VGGELERIAISMHQDGAWKKKHPSITSNKRQINLREVPKKFGPKSSTGEEGEEEELYWVIVR